MKIKICLATLTGLVIALIAGCVTKPPSAFEQRYFNITTNPPVLAVVTNYVPVTLYKTNEVIQTVTNLQNVVEFRTNLIPVAVATNLQAVTSLVTNEPETYNLKPKPEAIQPIQTVGGLIGNLFGAGGLVTTAIGAAFSLWGFMRSKKTYATATDLAQIIETVRSFVRQLPNGANYDTALVNFMVQHQAEAGTINQVAQIVAGEVNTSDAQVAAEHIRQSLAALGVPLPPAPAKA